MVSEREKLQNLRSILRRMGKVAVAYSGGADSTFLLKVARDELGGDAIAVLNASEVIPADEAEEAVRCAKELGVETIVVRAIDMDNREFRENGPDRCYICKRSVFQTIQAVARERGIEQVVDGGHTDDSKEDRPGTRALVELGVRSPLAEARLGKEEVRRLSRELGVKTADKPASPCLATRIPFYEPITAEKLAQVDRAERFVRGLGVRTVRVRHHGNLARIEVQTEDFTTVLRNREKIAQELRSLGFIYIALDLMGFRTGSSSEALKRP